MPQNLAQRFGYMVLYRKIIKSHVHFNKANMTNCTMIAVLFVTYFLVAHWYYMMDFLIPLMPPFHYLHPPTSTECALIWECFPIALLVRSNHACFNCIGHRLIMVESNLRLSIFVTLELDIFILNLIGTYSISAS